MKIVIPTTNGKLCGHFGKCDSFTFAEIDPDKKKVIRVESKIPDEGISCQSASWISEQGANIILAGGMGARPLDIFARNGVTVISGCPEIDIRDLLNQFVNDVLVTGENSCGGDHHHCHGHGEGHCHGHHG